jgi:hypothetical protein
MHSLSLKTRKSFEGGKKWLMGDRGSTKESDTLLPTGSSPNNGHARLVVLGELMVGGGFDGRSQSRGNCSGDNRRQMRMIQEMAVAGFQDTSRWW